MKQGETPYVRECIRAFVTHGFQFIDAYVFNEFGIEQLFGAMARGELGSLKGFVWRNNVGGTRYASKTRKDQFVKFGFAGKPDLEAIALGGVYVGCEVKKPGEKASKVQEAVHAGIRYFGGRVFVAHGFEECDLMLRMFGL